MSNVERVHTTIPTRHKKFCEENGFSYAKLLRAAIEEKMREMGRNTESPSSDDLFL